MEKCSLKTCPMFTRKLLFESRPTDLTAKLPCSHSESSQQQTAATSFCWCRLWGRAPSDHGTARVEEVAAVESSCIFYLGGVGWKEHTCSNHGSHRSGQWWLGTAYGLGSWGRCCLFFCTSPEQPVSVELARSPWLNRKPPKAGSRKNLGLPSGKIPLSQSVQ